MSHFNEFTTSLATIKNQIDSIQITKPFNLLLSDYIKASNEKDSTIYTRAGVSRQVFHKIMTYDDYTPSKDIVFSFAVALKLSYEDCSLLFQSLGYSFSSSNLRDIIFANLLKNKDYNFEHCYALLNEYHLKELRTLKA